MKCSILSKFFGTFLLAAMTLNFCYAEETENFAENFFEKGIDADYSSSSNRNDARRATQTYLSECEVTAVDLAQFYAIYMKAGIETIAKGTVGDEFFNVVAALEQITYGIDRVFNRCDVDASCTRTSVNVLLNRQSNLVFDYTRALLDGNTAAQNTALNALRANSVRIRKAMQSYIPSKSDAARVARLLTEYSQTTLALAQNFVTAVTTVLPPGGTADFTAAYNTYAATLTLSRQLGRVLGSSTCESCNPRPNHCLR